MIAAATEIVSRDGVQGLTARKVAAAIGYAPGTIYNVVGNLDDLILQVNGRTLDRLIGVFSSCDIAGEPRADMATFVEAYLAFEERHAELWAAIFEHVLPGDRLVPDWYSTKIETLLGLVGRALQPLFSDTGEQEARTAVKVIWSGLHGITSLARSDKLLLAPGETPRSMAHNLVETYLAGLEGRRPASRA